MIGVKMHARVGGRPHSRTRLRVASLLGCLGLVTAAMSPAHADGGPSIAAAPAISVGVQQFGNTANGAKIDYFFCDGYYQYWLLPVAAGDEVTITWEVFSPDQASMDLSIYPVGTNDFNVFDTEPSANFFLNSNLKAESQFSASGTGTMPVQFTSDDCDEGPYAFTVSIKRSIAVSVEDKSSVPLKGSLGVSARTPEGIPVTSGLTATLQVKGEGRSWTAVGSRALIAAPTEVPYTLPKSLNGGKLKIRASVAGPGFSTTVSAKQTVRVGQAIKVKLSATDESVRRLSKVRLKGSVRGVAAGVKVTIMQNLVSGTRWVVEGRARLRSDGKFRYNEIVHGDDRYYRACVKSVCSATELVRVT